jgi:hypothetical protein
MHNCVPSNLLVQYSPMIKPTNGRVLRYQRSKLTPRAVLIDANLDLHSLDPEVAARRRAVHGHRHRDGRGHHADPARVAGFPCSVRNQQRPRGRYLGVCLSNYLLSGEDSVKLRPDHDACSFSAPAGPAARLLK